MAIGPIALVLLVLIAALVGGVAGQKLTARLRPDVLQAGSVVTSRLAVTDQAGRGRALVACHDDTGSVAVMLMDRLGRTRLGLTAGAEGEANVVFCDAGGSPLVDLGAGADGRAALMLFDRQAGVLRIGINVADGAARLAVFRPDGKAAWVQYSGGASA
ncbi:MAG: hypothetical protein AMXMBFR13_26510 [Phycisphaerae bacterium]